MKKRRILSALLAFITAAGTALGTAGVTAAESPYKDVKTERWSFNEIMYATESGYMNGKGGGLFAPEETMTRAMVVTVLYRFQGEPDIRYQATFSDVKKKDWFANAVLWAESKGIVNGVEPGKFAPNEDVTRQQLAAILMRYAPLEYIKDDSRKDITGYKDYKKVQSYARDAMSWANATGLITGVTTTTLEPAKGATREQFAVILKRFKDGAGFDYELAYNDPVYSTEIKRDTSLESEADIYVAADGNDKNAGTFDKPIATLARAKEMVRELKKTATREIVVAFKAGNYGPLNDITFTAEDAGTPDVPIRYTAYGDGEVLFENGISIREDEFVPIEESDKYLFEEVAFNDIYKVSLKGLVDEMTDTNILFSRERGFCDEARYPNKTGTGDVSDVYFRNMTTTVDPLCSIELQYALPKVVERFRTVEGMKVTGYLRRGYLIDTFVVKSYDPETHVLEFDIEKTNFDGTYDMNEVPLMYEGRCDDTIYFHNLSDALDYENEYWFDPATKILYVYKPSGDYTISMTGGQIILEDTADYITFEGLTFDGSTENVIVSEASNITLDGCTFGNCASQIIAQFDDAVNITVENCEFYNYIACAVIIKEELNMNLLESGHTVVTNNYFHDFGLQKFFLTGMALRLINTIEARVDHNVYERGAHGAVELVDCIDTLIEKNVFDHMMLTTGDFGAVYMNGLLAFRSNVIRYNLFTNIKGIPGYGIYIDDISSGQEIYGNIFYNAGAHAVTLHACRDNEVHDNIIINRGRGHTNCQYDGDFLMYTEGIFAGVDEDGNVVSESYWYNRNVYGLSLKPEEGEEGYELWLERWPILYRYNFDITKEGELDCMYTMVNYIKNNAIIGPEFTEPEHDPESGSAAARYGVFEGNKNYSLDENPFFVDPTHGDYRMREDADFFSIDFSSIGLKH